MADRSVVVRLRAEVDAFVAGMKRAEASASQFGREMTGRGKTVKADLDQIGRGAALAAGGIAVGLGVAAKAALDWESAWAGVEKTVDGTASQMADLESGLRDLAKNLPATHGEIAAVAEAAGQLGIQRTAIESFTETMIALGETTNLTADQAATSLARMSNIMQTPQADIERMASTLVALGNAGASTESEILDMALRISGAAKQVGISEDAALAFANALSSVGIEAEAGGTAISTVFSKIASAVAEGGEAVQGFSDVAGMSADEFSTAFRDDAAAATLAFIEGLDGITVSGGNVFAVLKDLELGDIRVRDALLRASGAGDLFRESLALGAEEWERNNALQTEAEKRYDTTAAKLEVARNNAVDLAIDLGGVLLPALAGAAEGATTMVRGFAAMPGPVEAVTVGIGGIALAGSGLIVVATKVIPKIQQVRNTLIGMGAAGRVAAAAMPWLAAAAAAVGVVSYAFGQNSQEAEEAEARIKGYTDAIREAGDATAGTKSHVEAMLADSPQLASVLEDAGVSADELGSALAGSNEGWDAMSAKLLAAAEDAGMSGIAFDGLETILGRVRQEALTGAEQAETLGNVMGDTGDAADTAAPKVGRIAEELGLSAEEAKAAREEFEDLLDAYRGAVDPLFNLLDALQANREAMGAEGEARAEALIRIAEANEDLADAEKDLRDARAIDDNAAGIVAAEERVLDARQRVTEAQEEAVISADELNRMNQDVAESALDVEVAARTLARAIEDGTVSVDLARSMLDEWVEQGSITQEQARVMAEQFGFAADEADRLAGDYNVTLNADMAEFNRKLDEAKWRLAAMGFTAPAGAYVLAPGAQGPVLPLPQGPIPGAASGGSFRSNDWAWVGEQGPELVRFGAAATVFPHSASMAMDRGSISAGSGFGGSSSIDRSRHVSISPTYNLTPTDPRELAAEVDYELRVLSAEVR